MIYKKTYRLCTVLLILGMGLMLLKENRLNKLQRIKDKSTQQLLEQSNGIIKISTEKVKESISESVRKMPTYKDLLLPMQQIEDLVIDFNTSLEDKKTKLEEARGLNLKARVESVQLINHSIQEESKELGHSLVHVLSQLQLNRQLGIRDSEVRAIEERLLTNISDGIALNIFQSIYNPESTQLELTKLKNKVHVISCGMTNFLAGKIGGGSLRFSKDYIRAENENVVKRGEPFESRNFSGQTSLVSFCQSGW